MVCLFCHGIDLFCDGICLLSWYRSLLTCSLLNLACWIVFWIIGLICKRALWKRLYSAKETYNLIDPTNRSHSICLFWRAHSSIQHANKNVHIANNCNINVISTEENPFSPPTSTLKQTRVRAHAHMRTHAHTHAHTHWHIHTRTHVHTRTYTRTHTHTTTTQTHTHTHTQHVNTSTHMNRSTYGVATIRRLLKIMGLFRRISSLL